jgi:hypothetical protein
MEANSHPLIASFVIRFVVDEPSQDGKIQTLYRGAIRHIQSDKEINFNAWEDAVAFIQHYVPLEIGSGKEAHNAIDNKYDYKRGE